ncbi:hypothetical protein DEI29_000508 [Salmonella enterica subsp. enterica]|nr:hypothetical protein [Salmonella enterica subsp. enterica]ELF6076843.1 hypothetical protein [Salmonella enterica]
MNITPFLSRLLSSAVNRGYFVSVIEGVIRIKINTNETLIIHQYTDGELSFYISFNGVIRSIPKNVVYDFLFSVDEYGFRIYSESGQFDKVGV